MKKTILFTLLLIVIIQVKAQTKDSIRLMYNHPELIVDLGTGLWGTPIPVDYDGDGLMDIMATCPDTPFKGVYYFHNIGDKDNPLFEAPIQLTDKTFKNLHGSYAGDKLYVFKPGEVYTDFAKSIFNESLKIMPDVVPGHDFAKERSNMWSYVDYDNDGDLDIIVGIDDWADYGWDNAFNEEGIWQRGPLRGYIYLLENIDGKYINKGRIKAGTKDLETFGAPSANMVDFDGDGKKDIIAGEFLDRLTFFKNIGTASQPKFDNGKFLENPKGDIIHMHVEMITPTAVDFDGDGKIDLIVGDEDGRVAFIKNTGRIKNNMPVFNNPVFLQQKAQYVKFGALSTPCAIDWDGDGYTDIISGNSAGEIAFIRNLTGNNNPKWDKPIILQVDNKDIRIVANENGSIQGPAEAKWGYTTLTVADWDGDSKKDIIVNSIFGKIIWYKNTGSLTQLEGPFDVKVDWGGSQQIPKPSWNWWNPADSSLVTQWRTTPIAIDWNKDGFTDLVSLNHEGYLTFYERFEKNGDLWLKPGKQIFYAADMSKYDHNNKMMTDSADLLQLNVGLAGRSGRRKICIVDWDNDGDLDLIVNSKSVTWFENVSEEDGKVYFVNRGELSDIKLAGHDTSPTPIDWDNDGVFDILVGGEDGHFYYIKNETVKSR